MSAIAGPFFDDLRRGQVFEGAPPMTLTDGHAALHQAIVGDRLRLALDAPLARSVTGAASTLAHPALVCDVAIGQSTLATQRVIANVFYRGLVLRRAPALGDTLATTTEIVALRENRRRAGRAPSGLAVLRVRCVDQDQRPVLDFWRCAMLPLSDPAATTGHADDLDAFPGELSRDTLAAPVSDWRLDRFRAAVPGPHFEDLRTGMRWAVASGDVVSSAPELARLTLNVAAAHHDAGAQGGTRLVYGGHTIGIAASQVTRALPSLVTILGWHSCEHLEAVHEQDTLRSAIELEAAEPLPAGGGLAHLRTLVDAVRDGSPTRVLDWRFVALMA